MCIICVMFCMCTYVLMETDKQLVELIHFKALNALSAHQQNALRYQSVTLFLRGRSTPYKWPLYCSNTGPIYYFVLYYRVNQPTH